MHITLAVSSVAYVEVTALSQYDQSIITSLTSLRASENFFGSIHASLDLSLNVIIVVVHLLAK